jgi:hypothetical protein
MTTKSLRPVTRETSAQVRDKGLRPLIVTLVGGVLMLRPKGLRNSETVHLASVYTTAVCQRVALARAERQAARRNRKAKGERRAR